VTRDELATLFRVTERTLRDWRGQGCPCDVTADGDEDWDPYAVTAWLKAGGLQGRRQAEERAAKALQAAPGADDQGAALADRITRRGADDPASIAVETAAATARGRLGPSAARAIDALLKSAAKQKLASQQEDAVEPVLLSAEAAEIGAQVDRLANARRRVAVAAFVRAQGEADRAELLAEGDGPTAAVRARLHLDAWGEPLEGRDAVAARLAPVPLGPWDVGGPVPS
jgi:phage terminase Nu1 subunit (DNA packaging protein)